MHPNNFSMTGNRLESLSCGLQYSACSGKWSRKGWRKHWSEWDHETRKFWVIADRTNKYFLQKTTHFLSQTYMHGPRLFLNLAKIFLILQKIVFAAGGHLPVDRRSWQPRQTATKQWTNLYHRKMTFLGCNEQWRDAVYHCLVDFFFLQIIDMIIRENLP